MESTIRYVGMDVHQDSTVIAVAGFIWAAARQPVYLAAK